MEKFSVASERLFQASTELRNRMAEIQQLRATLLSVEAARTHKLADPKTAVESAQQELRA